MAYNLYKHGVLSVDLEEDAGQLSPSNQREPFPPVITALFMHLHPGIDQSMTYASLANGVHTEKVKQVNLFLIALLIGVLVFLTWNFTRILLFLFKLTTQVSYNLCIFI